MKRIVVIVIIMLCAGWTMAQRTGVHASDARFVFVGRTMTDSTSVSMDWTGTYVRIRFYGSYLSVRASDSGTNYYNLYQDRPFSANPDRVITISGDTTIVLYDGYKASGRRGEKAAEHTLIIYKRTEGEQGRTTFHEFIVDGEILQAEPLKKRQIEFIGDSYTCGYGIENSVPTDRFSPQTESSAKTYAAIVSRYFDADFILIAHSGMGVARNYNSKFPGWYMPDRYLQTFDMDSTSRWHTTPYPLPPTPSITIILLGGNDFSVGKQPAFEDFCTNYQRMLLQIKANYGENHPILCCVKKGNDNLTEYVRQVVKKCGMQKVEFCPFYPAVFGDGEKFLGADSHPNYQAHRQAAYVLIPYISTLTNWPLTDTPIQ